MLSYVKIMGLDNILFPWAWSLLPACLVHHNMVSQEQWSIPLAAMFGGIGTYQTSH